MNDITGAKAMIRSILDQADSIDESVPAPYGYECIKKPEGKCGFNFRVHDAGDNRIATCYSEGHAKLIVRLMNLGAQAVEKLTDKNEGLFLSVLTNQQAALLNGAPTTRPSHCKFIELRGRVFALRGRFLF